MPQYNQIFSPETLATLKGKSKESLRQMLGNKNLMQAAMRSQQLLNEISRIEAPYIDELEEVAVQMAKDAYPILDYAGINIDAKIVGMDDVNASLDEGLNELEINKPHHLIKGEKYTVDNGVYFTKMVYDGIENKKHKFTVYAPPHIHYFIPWSYYVEPKDLQYKVLKHIKNSGINESQQPFTPEMKRRIINGISHGSAIRGTFGFLLFREYLDQLDPTLVDKYKELMNNVFGSYDDDNGVAMFLQMIQQGHKMGGGSSKVIIGGNINELEINKPTLDKIKIFEKIIEKLEISYPELNETELFNEANKIFKKRFGHHYGAIDISGSLNESQSEPSITIKARAICFPMLVHEIIKGLYEILSLQGFQGTKQQNQDVVNKVDKLEHEPEDLALGKFIYDALNQLYINNNTDDSRIRELMFVEIYKLPDSEFITFVENAINKTLTKSQLSWVNNIMKEIESDLKADDANL